jgi:hypothetical protein
VCSSDLDRFLSGELKDYAYPMSQIKRALKDLPKI